MTREQKIEEIYNVLKDHICYMKMGGSRILPFIDHPHDYDVIVVCEDSNSAKEASRLLRESGYDKKELIKEYQLDIHFQTIEQAQTQILDNVYSYLLHFGEDIEEEEKVDVLENIPRIRNAIINRYNRLKNNSFISLYDSKIWYYIHTAMCIINNESYELTAQQIENVNVLHDRKPEDLELRQDLINGMMEEIESWRM